MIQDTPSAVPRLATALTGPLQELERHFLANQGEDECANRFYAYGVVARLAALAAAREQQRVLEPPVSELKTAGLRQ